jgi:UTP:GlnB (protein PII) uridylyltransferase
VGERAEDVFYVTDLDNRPLDGVRAQRLREEMKRVLDRSRNS